MASTTDIEGWFEANEPDNPGELLALHEAFENLSDETIYSATDKEGTVFVHGSMEPRTLVLPSEKAKEFFRRKLGGYKKDEDFDFDEEADFYRSINNPHS